jgi:hypothetical protein
MRGVDRLDDLGERVHRLIVVVKIMVVMHGNGKEMLST